MRLPFKKILPAIVKTVVITIAATLLLMFLLPMLFPDKVSNTIKKWTNESINSELNFSKARLSFFNHFPSLTLTLYNFTLKGSPPFAKDTLLAANEVAFGINVWSVFGSKIKIDEVYLTQGNVNIEVNGNGDANYNVYKSGGAKKGNDSSTAALKIEKIQVEHTNVVYDDQSLPMHITAKELNYNGQGDLSKAVFDLTSHVTIDSFDLDYDNQHYIGSKRLNADLLTKINTQSLAFLFEKNDLHINSLPVQFKGRFEFLPNGYDMDFRLTSGKTDLHDVLSAMPQEYLQQLDNTDMKGSTEITAYLTGKYVAGTNTMPSLGLTVQVRDGLINNSKAPSPATNVFLNFDTQLPSLNTDSLYVNIDSLYFNIDKDYFSGIVKLNNLNKPGIQSKINARLDLEKWYKAFGIKGFDLKGQYELHFRADGRYATAVVPKGIRGKDTVVTSVPVFQLSSRLSNGYFKYDSLPQALHHISFALETACPDSNYKHTTLSLTELSATALNNFIKGYIKVNADSGVDLNLQSALQLAELQQFVPLDSLWLKGKLAVAMTSKGIYNPAQHHFPVTAASIVVKDGSVQTKYYPHAVENIQIDTKITSRKGTMKDLAAVVSPASFTFEDEPFHLSVHLADFTNVNYQITANGTLNLGNIYKVFARDSYGVRGLLKANISLHGLQSNATNARYSRLQNKGTLTVQDIALSTDLYPQPFYINSGVFSFANDKMWFKNFNATYGKTHLSMTGYLTNFINYALTDRQVLKGHFNFTSDHVYASEFAAFSSSTSSAPSAATGVVIVPANLSIQLNAEVAGVDYNSLNVRNFKGQLMIDSGALAFRQAGFTLVDAPVSMDGSYKSLSATKALFTYAIKAKNFDIKKGYKQVAMFREMAPSASKAEGIVSLDYQLAGRLDHNMNPVYPSLTGGGVLTLDKVKFKNFRLFTAVSKATNRDSLNDPSLTKVEIKSSISNNIITIQRTKMKVFGFRPRFEGQCSFDGRLNLSGRLGLPPFGIFGIPFTVTGTQQNPKVSLRRNRESDTLTETGDSDEAAPQ